MSNKTFFIGALISIAAVSGVVGLCTTVFRSQKTATLPATCSVGSSHPLLPTARNASLRKMAEYELLCKGAATTQLMTFAPMPTTNQESTQFATTMTDTLKEFANFSFTPLIVFEPSLSQPATISDIKNGIYDEALRTYFQTLKQAGISDTQMGTWVLFPEANTPTWHNTSPIDFVANVTKVASLQKAVFPSSKTSILLNSWSYPSDDSSWSRGELKSLLPYIDNLPAGIIDSFGLQGFPYKPPRNTEEASRTSATDFLPAYLVKEVAHKLKLKTAWLNTGTFSRMYAGAPDEVHLSAEERKDTLQSILQEAATLQKESLDISVNIFAQNKANLAERVDWSYWPTATPAIGPDAEVCEMFLRQLRSHNIHLSLYDTMN